LWHTDMLLGSGPTRNNGSTVGSSVFYGSALGLCHLTDRVKIYIICFAKPGLTEDLYIVHKEEFSITWLYVRYIHLTKVKPIHKRQTHLHIRQDVTEGL
jgi:hypothetical protein